MRRRICVSFFLGLPLLTLSSPTDLLPLPYNLFYQSLDSSVMSPPFFSCSYASLGSKVQLVWTFPTGLELVLQRGLFGSLICKSVTYNLHRASLLVSVFIDNSHVCQEYKTCLISFHGPIPFSCCL